MYLFGWVICFPSGIVFAFVQRLWEKRRGQYPHLGICVTAAHFCFVLFLFHPRWTLQIRPLLQLGIFLLVHWFGVFVARIKSLQKIPILIFEGRVYYFIMGFFIFWFLNANRKDNPFTGWTLQNYLLFVGVFLVFHFCIPVYSGRDESFEPMRKPVPIIVRNVVFYFLSFFAIFFLVVQPRFNFDYYHYLYVLGPASDLIYGKAILANINAQYGILIFYFLKIIFNFLPLGFTSFAVVLAALEFIQYSLFFFIVKQLFRGWIMPIFSILALLLINYFIASFFNSEKGIIFPSVGALRFGFIYILMSFALLRNRYPKVQNLFLLFEIFTVGIAFFWSFEVCWYTVPSYFAFIVFESIKFEKPIRFDRTLFFKKTLFFIGWLLVILSFIYLDTFHRAGIFPHWSYYFDYVFLYKNGFGMMQMPGLGIWMVIIGTYCGSLLSIIGIMLNSRETQKPLPRNLNVILLVTFYGIFQFFYYLGRAHPTNLLHVAMPVVLLVCYWLYFLRRFNPASVPTSFKKLGFTLAVIFIGIVLQNSLSYTLLQIKDRISLFSTLCERIKTAVQDRPRDDGFALFANHLIQKYSGNQKSLVYFLGNRGADVEMYTGRVKQYPYNDVDQASICVPVLNRIKVFQPLLNIGDYVYVSQDLQDLSVPLPYRNASFEEDLLKLLLRRYILEIVEDAGEICVYRVKGEVFQWGELPKGIL